MDQESGSGVLVNIVCANLTERGERLLRIADKLRARAERQNV